MKKRPKESRNPGIAYFRTWLEEKNACTPARRWAAKQRRLEDILQCTEVEWLDWLCWRVLPQDARDRWYTERGVEFDVYIKNRNAASSVPDKLRGAYYDTNREAYYKILLNVIRRYLRVEHILDTLRAHRDRR